MVPSGTGLNPNVRSGVKATGPVEATVIFEKIITENNTNNAKTKYFFFMGNPPFCCARQGIDFFLQTLAKLKVNKEFKSENNVCQAPAP